jgi:hypothetical protein
MPCTPCSPSLHKRNIRAPDITPEASFLHPFPFPHRPGVDNQALEELRTWRLLEERQSAEEPLPGHRERVNE